MKSNKVQLVVDPYLVNSRFNSINNSSYIQTSQDANTSGRRPRIAGKQANTMALNNESPILLLQQRFSPHIQNLEKKNKNNSRRFQSQKQSINFNDKGQILDQSQLHAEKKYKFPQIIENTKVVNKLEATQIQQSLSGLGFQSIDDKLNNKSYDNRYQNRQSKTRLSQYDATIPRKGNKQSPQHYDIPNLKVNDQTFDFAKPNNGEVFYSIKQQNEQDFINASLNIVNTKDPNSNINFVARKRKKQKSKLQSILQESPSSQANYQKYLSFMQTDALSTDDIKTQGFRDQTTPAMLSKVITIDNLNQKGSQQAFGIQNHAKPYRIIPKKLIQEINFQLDAKEIDLKDQKKTITQNYENQLKNLKQFQELYEKTLQVFLDQFPDKHFQQERDLIERIFQGLKTNFKSIKSLSIQQMNMLRLNIENLQISNQDLQKEFDNYKATQSLEAYFIKASQSQDNPDTFVKNIDDFLKSESLKKQWDVDKFQRELAMENTKPSNVNQELRQISASMKGGGYKDYAQLLQSLGLNDLEDDFFEITQKDKVVSDIQTGLTSQITSVQKYTAKKILSRFLKQIQTESVGCQAWSMEELTYQYMKEIDELKDRFENLRFGKIQLEIKHDKLQEQYNALAEAKAAKERQLVQDKDKMEVEWKIIREEKEKLLEEIQEMKDSQDRLLQQIEDLEKQVDEKEELQSRLNSLRNKYEEYDRVNNTTEGNEDFEQDDGWQFNEDYDRDQRRRQRNSVAQGSPYKSQATRNLGSSLKQVGKTQQQLLEQSFGANQKSSSRNNQLPLRKSSIMTSQRSQQQQQNENKNYSMRGSDFQDKEDAAATPFEEVDGNNDDDYYEEGYKSGRQSKKLKQLQIIKNKEISSKNQSPLPKMKKNVSVSPDIQIQKQANSIVNSIPVSTMNSPKNMKVTISSNSQSNLGVKVPTNTQNKHSLYHPSSKQNHQQQQQLVKVSKQSQGTSTQQVTIQDQSHYQNSNTQQNNTANNKSQMSKPQMNLKQSQSSSLQNNSNKQYPSKSHQPKEINESVLYETYQQRAKEDRTKINHHYYSKGKEYHQQFYDVDQTIHHNHQHNTNNELFYATANSEMDPKYYQKPVIQTVNPQRHIDTQRKTNVSKFAMPSIKSHISISTNYKPQQVTMISTDAGQTDNEVFMNQVVELVKLAIIHTLEQERYKYSDKEYDTLIKKALEIVNQIKSRHANSDVFFKAGGVFLPHSKQVSESNLMQQKGTKKDDEQRQQVQQKQHQSSFRVEEHFKVKIQRRVGGAGNFTKFGDRKPRDMSGGINGISQNNSLTEINLNRQY